MVLLYLQVTPLVDKFNFFEYGHSFPLPTVGRWEATSSFGSSAGAILGRDDPRGVQPITLQHCHVSNLLFASEDRKYPQFPYPAPCTGHNKQVLFEH